jgi:hypothetical protein
MQILEGKSFILGITINILSQVSTTLSLAGAACVCIFVEGRSEI